MADSKVIIELGVTGNAEVQIKKITESISDLSVQGTKSLDKLSGAFDVFAGVLSAEAVLGAVKAFASAATGLFETLVTDGVHAAIEQENALNALNQALLSSGKYSKDASEGLKDFASGLQLASKFSDETILSSAALIENMAHLDEDGLKRATTAAANLASTFRIDLESAAQLVGKAANGQVAGLQKLVGAIEKGDTASQTFANAMAKLEKFSGAAAAELNTFAGAQAVLNNQLGESQEQIGNAIIKNQSLVSVLKVASELAAQFSKYLEDNQEAFAQLVSQGVLLAVDALGYMVDAAQAAVIGFLAIKQAIIGVNGVFFSFLSNIPGMGDFEQAAADLADQFNNVSKELDGARNNKAFDSIREGIGKLRTAAVEGFGKSTDEVDRFANSNRQAAEAVVELSESQQKLIEQGRRLFEETQNRDPNVEFEKKKEALIAYFEFEATAVEDQQLALSLLEEDRANKKSALVAKEAEELLASNSVTLDSDKFTQQARVRANIEALQEILKNEDLNAKDRAKIAKNLTQLQSRQEQDRFDAASNSLNALSSLQTAKSKELAAVGKAAAIAQTTIDTYRGATAAAAALSGIPFVGPALGIAAAAAFITAGLARVAQIAGVPLATGMTEVPAGFGNDSFPARLSSGERVVDSGTNQDLKSFLGASNEMVPLLRAIAASVQNSRAQVTVVVGTKTIFDSVVDGLQDGRVLEV